jgi:hypothetical protein
MEGGARYALDQGICRIHLMTSGRPDAVSSPMTDTSRSVDADTPLQAGTLGTYARGDTAMPTMISFAMKALMSTVAVGALTFDTVHPEPLPPPRRPSLTGRLLRGQVVHQRVGQGGQAGGQLRRRSRGCGGGGLVGVAAGHHHGVGDGT